MSDNKNRLLKFWILVFSMSLVPAVALGADPQVAQVARTPSDTPVPAGVQTAAVTSPAPSPSPSNKPVRLNDTLTLDEANNTFLGFDADFSASDSKTVQLDAFVFEDCLKKPGASFSISIMKLDAKGKQGFLITDKGGVVRGCMADHKRDNDTTESHKAIELSKIGGSFKPDDKDLKIGFCSHNPNLGPGKQDDCVDFARPLSVKSSATVKAEWAAEQKRKHDEQADRAARQWNSCKRENNFLALNNLLPVFERLGLKTPEEIEAMKAQLDKEELSKLLARAKAATNANDMANAAEDLRNFASDRDDESIDKKVALASADMASRLIKDPDATDESLGIAEQMLRDARADLNLPKSWSDQLAKYYAPGGEIPMAKGMFFAKQGDMRETMAAYKNNYKPVTKNYMQSCNFQAGRSYNMETCMAAQTNLQTLQQLPMIAQQVQSQNAMMQNQMMARLQQTMGQQGGSMMMSQSTGYGIGQANPTQMPMGGNPMMSGSGLPASLNFAPQSPFQRI